MDLGVIARTTRKFLIVQGLIGDRPRSSAARCGWPSRPSSLGFVLGIFIGLARLASAAWISRAGHQRTWSSSAACRWSW